MRFSVSQGSLTEASCDALIVNLFQDVKHPGGGTGAVDRALGGAITQLIADEGFEGKLGQTAALQTYGRIPATKVILVGLGKAEEFTTDGVRRASAAAAKRAADANAKKVSTILHGAGIGGLDPGECTLALVEGAALGLYKFLKYKTVDRKETSVEEVEIVEMDASKLEAIRAGAAKGEITSDATIFARDLVNDPSNSATPTMLAETARKIAEENGLECSVLDREQIAESGMNLLLAVAQGSAQPPKFIVLRYSSPGASRTVAIVGKGITFDSGGLSLKPADGMENMKDDMSGSAAVLAAMRAITKIAPPVNVLGIAPATENMPGGGAVKPGDVIRSLNGKTVEINNTDAEGRLVLADALAYAVKEGADEIIDVATLTGACVVALGRGMSGIMSNNDELADRLIAIGEKEGDPLWRLPLFKDYKEMLISEVADLKNAPGREAGAIAGGMFLHEFVEDKPWAHIDIAGPSFLDKATLTAPKGGTAAGTRILVRYLMEMP
ncbi:MAG: leucyl aminopeptidase [Armatimonadota bacterium]|nr:leucyl aminopeptidase [Armatimonadota bacterium]